MYLYIKALHVIAVVVWWLGYSPATALFL